MIKDFEQFSTTPYICPAGYWTIAFGHLIRKGEVFTSVTEEEGEAILEKDLYTAERAVLRLISVPLSDSQFDALVSFVFNLGSGALQSSTLRMKINRGEYSAEVAVQFMRWVYAGGRKLNGLIRRRRAEADMYCMSANMGLKQAA